MNLVEKAQLVAEKVHFGQSYDIYPYTRHLRDVVEILENVLPLDYPDREIYIASGWLHDGGEDTHLSYSDMKRHFGIDVAEIVYACTDELGRNRKERHAKTYIKLREEIRAIVVKLADRLANAKYGKEMGSSQFEMYRKEHPEFKKALYITNIEVHQKLWDRLDALFV